MSRGKKLQEMEVKTQQSKTAVNSGAKPADPMPTMADPGTQLASVEDLGGPTPENYKPDDDSAKLKEPGGTLKQVRDVVTKSAGKADPMPAGMKEDEELSTEDTIEEEETVTDEVVSEEETTEEEVVSEEETTEEEVIAEQEFSVEEDVNALFEGEELSEEFQEKARTIFEAAIKSKIVEIEESIKSAYEEQLVEEVATIKSELQERVDSYLEYVADEWVSENQLAVEHGLQTEMTESFLTGMKSLFEEHYVTIPEEKYDVIESMVDKLDEMEGKLNEQIERNIALNKRLAETTADVVFADVTEGLAATQKDKLASLVENVEFESESDYREKLVTLKESYFPENAGAQRDTAENLSEETNQPTYQEVSGTMEKYLQTLNRVSRK